MLIGIVGTGAMGSNIARCLAGKGFKLVLYNRTRSKAEKLAEEIGASIADTPRSVAEEASTDVVMVSDDNALNNVVYGDGGIGSCREGGALVLNASTVTPMTSTRVYKYLATRGLSYLEAPVLGSAGEARECKLVSMIAGDPEQYLRAKSDVEEYSSAVHYVGEVPSASVVKLAVNNVLLSIPALLAESLALLEAWGVDPARFKEVVESFWIKPIVDKYWGRIVEEKPTRFKVQLAGKDCGYVASALREKGLPAFLSSTASSMYYSAASNSYLDKDYPLIERVKRTKQEAVAIATGL